MKINLHDLACELAKQDNPAKENIDVIDAETVLANLGRKLRSASWFDAAEIVLAIACRAGKDKE